MPVDKVCDAQPTRHCCMRPYRTGREQEFGLAQLLLFLREQRNFSGRERRAAAKRPGEPWSGRRATAEVAFDGGEDGG